MTIHSGLPTLLLSTVLLVGAPIAWADPSQTQDTEPQQIDQHDLDHGLTLDELRKIAQNPLSPVLNLPTKFTFYQGGNHGDAWVLSTRPTFTFEIGDWNLVNQMRLNFIDTPTGGVTGIAELPNPYPGKGSTGLADLNYSLLLSPDYSSELTWGFGGTVTMPTDHPSRVLGSGKWSAGPAFVVLSQPDPWTVGIRGQQIWSIFGNEGREGVNQMLLEPFINFNLDNGWYLVTDMTIVSNWDKRSSEQWTVPVGGGFGKLFEIGNQPINTRLEAYWNAVKPDDGADWTLNFTLQFLFPST